MQKRKKRKLLSAEATNTPAINLGTCTNGSLNNRRPHRHLPSVNFGYNDETTQKTSLTRFNTKSRRVHRNLTSPREIASIRRQTPTWRAKQQNRLTTRRRTLFAQRERNKRRKRLAEYLNEFSTNSAKHQTLRRTYNGPSSSSPTFL